jgi:hypothetical protein
MPEQKDDEQKNQELASERMGEKSLNDLKS